jgi:hypothetical protein
MKNLINYKGINFEVSYTFTKETKGDYITAPTSECVEIEDINQNGTDFTEFLQDDLEEIEEILLNECIDR